MDEALNPLDERTIGILVDNHRAFRSFLAKRVGSDSVAEDLLQASIKKALETPARPHEDSTVVAWFYQVLRNTLTDHYRSQASEQKKHGDFAQELVATGKTHERSLDDLEAGVCECMSGLLPTLKDSYAEVIRRVDLEGESVSSVAQALRVTENNLSVRLHRARDALRKSLERTCGTCTEHGCLSCTCE